MKTRSVLWLYLTQKVFTSKHKLVINPFRFLFLHRVELLEQCWQKDYRIELHRQQFQKLWRQQDDVTQMPPQSNMSDRTQK
ncbi:MAG: hypothetical protein QNJ46_15055 [Leptolyngbyaceae cyanobacterium MO_188.B28]|nr:hypothetical protein [Leptolyngbyaceae cyanobacterium MO_188.B28]